MNSPESRADIHVHSRVSNQSSRWALRKIGVPECFTEPEMVYHQARRRGMDFVTITDHDSIEGALSISHLPGTFISEEVTSYFPETGCKIHVVVLGLSEKQHGEIQNVRHDVYDLVAYLRQENLVHIIAHPLYGIDHTVGAEHVEKLILLFKHFEVLNGQHSTDQCGILGDILSMLTPEIVGDLAKKHNLEPQMPEPWVKYRTGGSDDHSTLAIGNTSTAVPRVDSPKGFLAAIQRGDCQPRGDGARSTKLAHAIYSVGYQYYSHQKGPSGNKGLFSAMMARLLEPESAKRKSPRVLRPIIRAVRGVKRKVSNRETNPIARVLKQEIVRYLRKNSDLRKRLTDTKGKGPTQEDILHLADDLSTQLLHIFAQKLTRSARSLKVLDVFENLAALTAIHTFLGPYYFSFAHVHKDRRLVSELRKRFLDPLPCEQMRLGLYTDTFAEVNGVTLTIRRMAQEAMQQDLFFRVETSLRTRIEIPEYLDHFAPVGSIDVPEYPELALNFPPVLTVLNRAEANRFDVIHVSTPGIVGLLGIAAGRMLRIPVAGTYHTDLPAYVGHLTRDPALEETAWKLARLFYNHLDMLVVPSHATARYLAAHGIDASRMVVLTRGVDSNRFHPEKKNPAIWKQLGLGEGPKLLYVGRISREKNLYRLREVFLGLLERIPNARLAIVGDGPYREKLEQEFRETLGNRYAGRVVFTGYERDHRLAELYASSDLFLFPSRTDTLGNVVMEAQASGVPAVVSDIGGPQECIRKGESGLAISFNDNGQTVREIAELLQSPERLDQMGREARSFAETRRPETFFKDFWRVHHELLTRT